MLQDVIKSFTSNLKSLREFVDLVDSFLKEKEDELYEVRKKDLIPLRAGFQKIADSDPDIDFTLTDDDLNKMKEDFGGDFTVEIQDDGEGFSNVGFKVLGKDQERFHDAMGELRKSTERSRLLYYSALMNITSIVEWYFSQILHFYFDKHPQAIGISEKVFSYEDLKGFESIEDARKNYKETRIESILRDSFKDWINFLRQSNINLKMGFISMKLKKFYTRHS